MTAILSRAMHTAGYNHEVTIPQSGNHFCFSWWKPTSPTTTFVPAGHPAEGPIRYVELKPTRSTGWTKIYTALDWRWRAPWPNDGLGGVTTHGQGFFINFHNSSFDNNGGVGWNYGSGVSAVSLAVNPLGGLVTFQAEHCRPSFSTSTGLVCPAGDTWQSLMMEVTPGLVSTYWSTGYNVGTAFGGDVSANTLLSLSGGLTPTGRVRIWQDGSLTFDSNTFFSGAGINTLQVAKNLTTGVWAMQGLFDIWQGSIYTSSWGVAGDGIIEATAMRVGQTAAECLADTSITANTGFDLHGTYDSTQGGSPSANGQSGNSFATTPATGTRTVEQFVIPAEFQTSTAPVNSVAPAITGTATLGNTLTCSTGTWSQTPSAYVRQWSRSYNPTMAGATVNIGADQATYVVTAADVGMTIKCVVTASNAAGSGNPATSNTTAIIHDGTGNYVANSTFETDILYWALNNGGETLTRDTTEHNAGAASLKVVTSLGTFKGVFAPVDASGNGVGIAVNPGDQQRVTVWVKGAGNIRLASVVRNASDVAIATPNIVQAGSAGAFTKFEVIDDAVLPAGAAYRQISLTTGPTSQNLTLYIDTVSVIAYVPPTPPPPAGDGTSRPAGTRSGVARTIGGTHRPDEGGWF